MRLNPPAKFLARAEIFRFFAAATGAAGRVVNRANEMRRLDGENRFVSLVLSWAYSP